MMPPSVTITSNALWLLTGTSCSVRMRSSAPLGLITSEV